MFISKAVLLFFVVIFIFSVFIADIAHHIDLDTNLTGSSKFDMNTDLFNYANLSIIGESSLELMWFIQISDLHLSIFRDSGRTTELQEFCCSTVDIINPSVVVASGDLTDAKHKDNMGSGQYEGEWMAYADTLKKCKIQEKTLWLDIRGNHDNFNVPGWESEANYYRYYSIQGGNYPRSYMHMVEKNGKKYAFMALDACLEPGPRRPFNFIGMMTSDHVKEVKSLIKTVRDSDADHTIWFGHYPTSCILSPSDDPVRKLIGDLETSKVYLCGHLHTMGGLISKMYSLQNLGFLELELGDWKDNRMYRVAAFDHGLFNFIDIQHGIWPVILITNPKNALYSMPNREPLALIKTSTHIRLLAFSISPIISVEVKINDGKWIKCHNIDGPLYTAPWSSEEYQMGIHTIYAKVQDEQGREGIVKQPFSNDATKLNFSILGKLMLMLDVSKIFQSLFGTMLVICTLPLIVLRFCHMRVMVGRSGKMIMKKDILHKWLRKMWMLSSVDHLFYPLVVYDIYLCFGPWAVGEIMEGYIGVIFAWGILVDGSFIPDTSTYVHGFLQLLVCQFPLTLFLAHHIDKRFQEHHLGKRISLSKVRMVFSQLPFLLLISANMLFAYFFYLAYGVIAFILGALWSWSVILNAYLWYKTVSISPEHLSDAAFVWLPNSRHHFVNQLDRSR